MKRLYIASLIALSALNSCKKLDESPAGILVKQQFYKTKSDAVAGVNGIYASLTVDPGEQPLYGRHINFLTDMTTDDLSAGPSAINPNVRSLSAVTYNATNDRVQVQWRQLYVGISRANVAIDQITGMDLDDASKQQLIKEAKFLRALFYFNLVRLWGDVPLVLHDPVSATDVASLQVGRATSEDVYKQIISDLTDAETLPEKYQAPNLGRATGGAAKSLLVKVYVTRKEWKKAIAKAEEVFAGPYGYALFDNYADVFNKASKNGKEHIFSAQLESNGGIGNSSTLMAAAFAGFSANIPADVPADNSIYNLFSDKDTRKAVTFYTSLNHPVTGQTFTFPSPYFGKYVDRSVLLTPAQASINFPVLRFADVLLLYAEAINEDSGPTAAAFEAINKVRRRAFGKPVSTPDAVVDLANLDQTQFREAVYLERRLEFVQEGQRWFDLVRTGRLVSEVKKVASKANVSDRYNLFPIPQAELSLNPELTQNPGY